MSTYPSARVALLNADIDAAAVSWSLVAIDGDYNSAHDFLNDLTVIGTKASIPGVAVNADATLATTAVSEATAIVIPDIDPAEVVDGLVCFVDTGVGSTSRLVHHYDRRAGNSLVQFTSDGGDLKVWFPGGSFFGIGG